MALSIYETLFLVSLSMMAAGVALLFGAAVAIFLAFVIDGLIHFFKRTP